MERPNKYSDERILLRPARAFQLADVSRSTGYALIASGEWPSIRIGKAIRIPVAAFNEWLTRGSSTESLRTAYPSGTRAAAKS